jgi:hypothetical protein
MAETVLIPGGEGVPVAIDTNRLANPPRTLRCSRATRLTGSRRGPSETLSNHLL